jgi:hypothetical protein
LAGAVLLSDRARAAPDGTEETRRPILLMVLCCDPTTIALTIAVAGALRGLG